MFQRIGLAMTLTAAACGTDGEGPTGPGPGPEPSALESCLLAGGDLHPLWTADNQHGPATSLAVRGSSIVVGSSDGSVKLWRADGSNPVYGVPFVGETDEVFDALAFASDGTVLGANQLGQVSEWRLSDSETMRTTAVGDVALSAIAVSEHADLAAVARGTEANDIWMLDRRTGTVGELLPTGLWGAQALAFGHDGSLFTAGHIYGVPAIERRAPGDLATVVDVWSAGLDTAPLAAVALDTAGTHLVAAGAGLVAVFDPMDLNDPIVTLAPGHDAVGIALLPGASVFVTAGREGTMRLWNAHTGEPLGMLSIAPAVGLGIDEPGERLFTTGPDGIVRAFGCGP